MPILQSLGSLASVQPSWSTPAHSWGAIRLYEAHTFDYATLYKTQPNIRVCVDFLARNIAQLGLHVFERVSETDRRRLRDHPLARLLERPLPAEFKVNRYQLISSLISDLGIYFNAYWLKVGDPGGQMGLLRIPPAYMSVQGTLYPTGYELAVGGEVKKLKPEQVVHFRGYNAESAVMGLSPLETLRRVLAEEYAAGEYRESFWRNSARMNGIIERPLEAPDWSATARERFVAEFQALNAGAENSGSTAVLEDGMTWKAMSFNAQESEYLAGRKLTREECARSYHIPLPMVGLLDHATLSNIREQHKNLYQDCLGPWLAMVEADIDTQLLPDFADGAAVYVEFNIAEKLQGSFEEQMQAMQTAVGRPWMTADEARARFNMPSLGGDAERLVTPLNVLIGGQASPRDSAPDRQAAHRPESKAREDADIDPTLPQLRARHITQWERAMRRHFERQRDAIIGKVPEKAVKTELSDVYDAGRWNRELRADLFALNVATATVWARSVAEQVEAELEEAEMYGWLEENARITAENINATTGAQIDAALAEPEPREAVRQLFELAVTVRAAEIAVSAVTRAANFGAQEGARQVGLRRKTWIVNSSNPRSHHALMDGETVPIGMPFSNGMMWPGDPAGGAENNAGCQCSVAFGR